jgi:hypothetical protein
MLLAKNASSLLIRVVSLTVKTEYKQRPWFLSNFAYANVLLVSNLLRPDLSSEPPLYYLG